MKSPLHIIHVEDSMADSELVQQMLKRDGFECEVQRVETQDQLTNALRDSKCDLILSDCTLPQFHGLEALRVAQATKPDIPFIFVSGTIGEETAIHSLQNGATDYVLKQRLSRLVPAVRRALTEAEGRSARRAMEAQLRQSRKLEAIGTFAGGIVHDLRNLLQLMKLNIDLLPQVANDPKEVGDIAARLDRVTDRGCDMMQELMLFARKMEAKLAPVDIATQIQETTRLIAPSLPEEIRLTLEIEKDLPPVPLDACQLDRILTNLIVNARDAMSKGGTLAISADAVRLVDMPCDLWQIKNAPYLRIRVTDTGSGMDEATQARIFEPFFTTKPAGKGTGLGLSVVFGLMEAHQGFIDLSSRIGVGTTFSLFFPLPVDAPINAERIQAVSPAQLLGTAN